MNPPDATLVRRLVLSSSATVGEAFFATITTRLAGFLGADVVLVGGLAAGSRTGPLQSSSSSTRRAPRACAG